FQAEDGIRDRNVTGVQTCALPIFETVQIHLSDMYKESAAAKAFVLDAARAGASGDTDALAKILAARIVASEAAIESGKIAMRVEIGRASCRERVERWA